MSNSVAAMSMQHIRQAISHMHQLECYRTPDESGMQTTTAFWLLLQRLRSRGLGRLDGCSECFGHLGVTLINM
jgi:hypothetical protein